VRRSFTGRRFRRINRVTKNVRTGRWLLFLECGHRVEVTRLANRAAAMVGTGRALCAKCGELKR
jgi:hypothetical protein